MTDSQRELLDALKAAKRAERAENIAQLVSPVTVLPVLLVVCVSVFTYLLVSVQPSPELADRVVSDPVPQVDIPERNTREYWDSKPTTPVQSNYDWSVIDSIVISGTRSSVIALNNEIVDHLNASQQYVEIHQNHWDWAGEATAIVYFKKDFRSLTVSDVTHAAHILRYLPKK